ncbi:hypothetical protein [Leisingera aquaemixtae]|uniref:Uncharacterized protein n=1 Tax=Leisingera aquaemixtae TaxID=1396826 RepID=A0A0P1HCU7_9RHOB|nr:hypothetical protein [Leisingera aquaemixtae]CUI01117.1 hypothetical protein PHA8399_03258 [Leisingera aquaemixtae]
MAKVESGSGAVTVGLEAVKFAFLLNGAGAVALLGFLATENIQRKPEIVRGVAGALVNLSIGAALAPLALMFTYWCIHAQYQAVARINAGEGPRMWFWKSLAVGAVLAGVCSVGAFVYSIWTLGPIIASHV